MILLYIVMSIAKGKAKKQREMKQVFSIPLFIMTFLRIRWGVISGKDFHKEIFIKNFFSLLRKKYV